MHETNSLIEARAVTARAVACHTLILAVLLLLIACLCSYFYWLATGLHGWTPWLYWEIWGGVIGGLAFANIAINGPIIAETQRLRDEFKAMADRA